MILMFQHWFQNPNFVFHGEKPKNKDHNYLLKHSEATILIRYQIRIAVNVK